MAAGPTVEQFGALTKAVADLQGHQGILEGEAVKAKALITQLEAAAQTARGNTNEIAQRLEQEKRDREKDKDDLEARHNEEMKNMLLAAMHKEGGVTGGFKTI